MRTFFLVLAAAFSVLVSAADAPALSDPKIDVSFEHFRRLRISISGSASLIGKSATATLSGVEPASAKFEKHGETAGATLLLPLPPPGKTLAPVTLQIEGQPSAPLKVPDLAAARHAAFEAAEFGFKPFVFSGDKFPSGDFLQPNLVEDLVGRYSLRTQFYDVNYNEVSRAEKPGRYGAIVTITAEGKETKRFITLCRMPNEIKFREIEMAFNPEFPAKLGLNPGVVYANKTSTDEFFKQLFEGSIQKDRQSAMWMAAMLEGKSRAAAQGPQTWLVATDARWWFGLQQKTGNAKLGCLIHVPKEYSADNEKRWPLLVFLHGSGERGDDIQKVKVHGPPKLMAAGQNLPFIVASPQCPSGQFWNPWAINALIDELSNRYRIDADRIYLTGLSMGGFGTWNIAAEFPEKFAAIAPICGRGNVLDAPRLVNLPTWVFHGGKDPAVPFANSERMVRALVELGGRVRFTAYPSLPHDSWTVSYDNPELYKWLLAQKRGVPEQPPAIGYDSILTVVKTP